MTESDSANSMWWPSVDNLEGAKSAANQGAGAALFLTGVTALFSVLSVFGIQILPGFSPWSFVDAALFALITCRIYYRFSRAWAVVGLLFFIHERAYGFYTRGITSTLSIFLGIALLMFFIQGVRGTFAFRRLSTYQQPTDGAKEPLTTR